MKAIETWLRRLISREYRALMNELRDVAIETPADFCISLGAKTATKALKEL